MSTEKIMEQAQVFASAWSVVGGPFDDGEAMDVATQEKDELKRMAAELVAERDALAEKLAELEGQEPVGEVIHSDVLAGKDGAYRHELLCDFRLGVQTELYARPVPAESAPKAVLLTFEEIGAALMRNGMYGGWRLSTTVEADARSIEAAVLAKNGINPQAKGD